MKTTTMICSGCMESITHSHEHSAHAGHTHTHRGYQDVLAIIEKADMTANARVLAVRLFTILGEAEAKVHGTDLSHVHFHEVGAIDSIVDILSVACLRRQPGDRKRDSSNFE